MRFACLSRLSRPKVVSETMILDVNNDVSIRELKVTRSILCPPASDTIRFGTIEGDFKVEVGSVFVIAMLVFPRCSA